MSRLPIYDPIKTEVIMHVQSSTVSFHQKACRNAVAAILLVDATKDFAGAKVDIEEMIRVLDP